MDNPYALIYEVSYAGVDFAESMKWVSFYHISDSAKRGTPAPETDAVLISVDKSGFDSLANGLHIRGWFEKVGETYCRDQQDECQDWRIVDYALTITNAHGQTLRYRSVDDCSRFAPKTKGPLINGCVRPGPIFLQDD